jgi:hypothetical protein
MTGLNRQAFEALVPTFEQEYQQSLLARSVVRQRSLGGGAKAKLETATEKLF